MDPYMFNNMWPDVVDPNVNANAAPFMWHPGYMPMEAGNGWVPGWTMPPMPHGLEQLQLHHGQGQQLQQGPGQLLLQGQDQLLLQGQDQQLLQGQDQLLLQGQGQQMQAPYHQNQTFGTATHSPNMSTDATQSSSSNTSYTELQPFYQPHRNNMNQPVMPGATPTSSVASSEANSPMMQTGQMQWSTQNQQAYLYNAPQGPPAVLTHDAVAAAQAAAAAAAAAHAAAAAAHAAATPLIAAAAARNKKQRQQKDSTRVRKRKQTGTSENQQPHKKATPSDSASSSTTVAVPPVADISTIAVPPVNDISTIAVPPVNDDSAIAVPPDNDDSAIAVPPDNDDTAIADPPVNDDTAIADPPVNDDTAIADPPVNDDTAIADPPVNDDTAIADPPVNDVSTIAIPHPDSNIFCRVPGRLGSVGAPRMYAVSVAEIHRRMGSPEFFNKSMLGTMLRRGKIRGCGDDLNRLLMQRGLESHPNKKRLPACTLSSFVEEEAIQLANDHRQVVKEHFPLIDLARLAVNDMPTPLSVAALLNDTFGAKELIDDMHYVAFEWTSGGIEMTTGLDSPIRTFTLMTHGFGPVDWQTSITLFEQFIAVLIDECGAQLKRAGVEACDKSEKALYFPAGMIYAELPVDVKLPVSSDSNSVTNPTRSFGDVTGRLSLCNRKYNITVGEILRRVRQPESLNLSILGSTLRKGKTKQNGCFLRDELHKHGIMIGQGRRKATKITCFTAFVEDEALTLADDLSNAVARYFPTEVFASAINSRAAARVASTPAVIAQRRAQLECARRIALSFSSLLSKLTLPIGSRNPSIVSDRAYLLKEYCNITHGFGPDVCIMWMNTLRDTFEMAVELLPIA